MYDPRGIASARGRHARSSEILESRDRRNERRPIGKQERGGLAIHHGGINGRRFYLSSKRLQEFYGIKRSISNNPRSRGGLFEENK